MIDWLFFNVQLINFWYALAGLAVLLLTFVLIFEYLRDDSRFYRKFISGHVWRILVVTTIGGASTTLFYSEILGFVPCSLCWLQRVALYPQVLMTLTSLKLKDAKHFPVYGIGLSIFGLLVAIYQYIYQMVPQELRDSGIVPCLADGTADCSTKVMEVFGFVTFPFLSGVLFLFLILLYLNLLRDNRAR